MKRTLAFCAVALITVSAMAQDKPAAKPAKAAKPKAEATQGGMPPAPKPSPEMQKLSKMLMGTWTTEEKFEPMMGMPATEGKGKAVFTRGPGGLSIIENYNSQNAMGKFAGHGVIYWDDKAKAYSGIWCDTMTPTGCDSSGTTKWEGDKLVGTMDTDMGGQKMKMRMTYSDIKPDSFLFTMETEMNGKYQKTGTISYTKAAATSPQPAAKKD